MSLYIEHSGAATIFELRTMQRLLPPIVFVIAALSMWALHACAPVATLVPSPLNWAGLILIVCGLAAARWGAVTFRRIGTEIMTFGRPDRLVTHGLFRYTRNPIYLGFVIALAGLAMTLGSVTTLIPVLGFFLLADRWYVPFEERRLLETFGPSYEQYASTVRRWL